MSLIRRLIPSESAAFREHMLRLGLEERTARFAAFISDEAIERYCDRVSWVTDILIGAFDGREVRASVHLATLAGGWPVAAELAVTVERDWQGRGVGTELCSRALLTARNLGFTRIAMICLLENKRMQRIAKKLRGQYISLDGTVESAVNLPPPDPFSIWQEALSNAEALFESFLCQFNPAAVTLLRPCDFVTDARPESGSEANAA